MNKYNKYNYVYTEYMDSFIISTSNSKDTDR